MNTGIIYDAITYSTIYFCRDAMYKIMRLYANKEDDIFFYYDRFRAAKGSITPPDDLYPFFCFENKGPSVITEYFRRTVSFETGTLNDFINELKKVAYFKRFVVFYYLDEYKKDIRIEDVIKKDPASVARAMVLLRDHGSKTDTFIRLFYDFERLTEELIQYFQILFHKLKLFHHKYRDVCSEAAENFFTDKNIKIISKSFGCNKLSKKTVIFGVSFFQCFAYLLQIEGKMVKGFVIGHKSYSSIPQNANYKHVTATIISQIIANDLMVDILNLLTLEPLTITQLSFRLHVSRTTVDRFVGFMYDNMAIIISKLNGNEKYYGINPEFFLVGKEVFNKKIDDLLLRL